MLKTKKKFLLMSILTIVAMLCCGLSLILSASTNSGTSTNVDMTVKAETPTAQGELGGFGYGGGTCKYYSTTGTLVIDGGYDGSGYISDHSINISSDLANAPI